MRHIEMMIRNIKVSLIPATMFVLLTDSMIIAQTGTDKKILAQLNDFCLRVPFEEIYVHSDREDYVAGEDIWFNVLVIDKQTGKLSGKSKLAYFELLSPENTPIVQKRLMIRDGFGPGSVLIPDTLSSGTYTCRVYTNWMKNFLPGNCFMKNINVYNPFRDDRFRRKIIYEKEFDNKLNIEFFPEGGTLLNDVPSKVGVKVSDRYQRGVPFTGIIRDNKGDSVTFFKTDEYGIASFEFTPVNGSRYYVAAQDSLIYLPEASDRSFSLKADNSKNDMVSILVSAGESIVSDVDKTFLLFIHTRGIKNYSQYFRISGKDIKITIPRISLLSGINHITLFSNDGKPLCERFIYTRKENLQGLIISGNDVYRRREKVTLQLDLAEAGIGSLEKTTLGLSVAPQSANRYSPDIEDYLVFGTEFGHLPWAGTQYKIQDADGDNIDNFLITASSRWLSWDKVLSDSSAPFQFKLEEDGHFLSGWLKKRDSPGTEPGSLLYLSVPGRVATFQYARTDSSGHFTFLLPADNLRRDLIIQPAIPDEDLTIQIESSFSLKITGSAVYADSLNKDLPLFATNFGTSYQVDKIYGTLHKIESNKDEDRTILSKRFYGQPEMELIMDDYIKLPVMQEIFFELTPGIRLNSRKAGYEIIVRNPVDNIVYEKPSLVMIDGVIIYDYEIIANLDPETVERIDATRTPYLTGDIIHYGIINIITRTGNLRNITLPDYAARLQYRVADPIPLFSASDYSDPGSKKSRIPDFRNTLFWNPSMKPDNDGKVIIEFWTSDRVLDYVVNIQGISDNGELISAKKRIKVN